MKKLFHQGLILLLLLQASACGDDFLDVNQDPNNPADVPLELLLPAGVTSTASVVGGDYAILGGIWSQYYTQNNGSNQYKDIDNYNILNTTYEDRFLELYAGALNDYKFVKSKAIASQDWAAYLMATVMEAYTYQVLVDLYDQIPFTEALQGNTGLLQPTYQAGPEVYDSLIVRLNKALALPLAPSIPATQGDVVFQGDVNQWVRFANTLKLKIYLRQVYARPAVAQAGISGLYGAAAPFLTTDADLAFFRDATGQRNPLFEQDQSTALNTSQNLRAATTLFTFLQANGDPRLDANYIPGTTGQKAMEPGTSSIPSTQLAPASVSRARISPTAPVYFISLPESYFLQAEAVLRGFGPGQADTLYQHGVNASFAQMGVARPAGLYPFPATGTFEEQLEAIIVQKWVAMAGTKQGLEAFLERNRTNYPRTSPVRATNPAYVPGQITYPVEAVTTGQAFPKRLIWPSYERTRNRANTPPQEPITKEVWWDVQ
jgi:Starch-binding associating with outer membrane